MTVSASRVGYSVLGLAAATTGLFGLPAVAQAGAFTAPTGLAPGSDYLLVFNSSTTTTAPTSSTIADYNSFVTTAAANNTSLPTTAWRAIASTASVDALTNINYASISADPVFMVNGTEVATSLANFFADTVLSVIHIDESGNPNSTYAWTGSNSDGTAASGATLGTTNPIAGAGGFGSANGLNFLATSNSTPLSVYAISSAIQVADVPEPPTGPLVVVGAALLAMFHRRRQA